MKKITISSVLTLAFITLMSFTNSPTPAPAAADVVKWSGSSEIYWNLWNSCNNEYITVTGTRDWKQTRVIANGVYHYQYHYMYKNVKGVGQTSGAKYKANYVYNWSAKSASCDYKSHSTSTWMLIGQGKTPNLKVKSNYRYSYKCGGDYDSNYDYSSVCK